MRAMGGQTDVVRWRLIALCQWRHDEFEVSIAKPTLSREVRAMGYRKLSARPRHYAQAAGAIDLFKTASLPCWTKLRARRASTQVAPARGARHPWGATGPT